jgi:pilus assembly protein Flp/PilA
LQILRALWSFRTYLAVRLGKDEKGATAVEYGIMIALIAAAIMVAVAAVGDSLYDVFDCVASSLTSFTNECS